MFVSTHALLTALSTLPQPVEPTTAGWGTLDAEIEALRTALDQRASGPKIDGWIRARFAYSDDVDASTAAGDQDLAGFDLDNARLRVRGEAAPGYSYVISVEAGDPAVSDAAGSGVALLDAYAGVQLAESLSLSVGRFSSTVLWNAGVEERALLFLDRSFLDEVWDGRDVGIELFYAAERFSAWASAQNGADGQGDDIALTARANVHLLGNAQYGREGALSLAPDEQHLTIGAAWFDDPSLDEGTAIAGDIVFARERWSAVAEIVDFGDDIRPAVAANPATGVLNPSAVSATGAETPWGVTVSYLIEPDTWEAGVRWQDFDDGSDTTAVSAVVNRHVAGHVATWTLQIDAAQSDDTTLEATTVALGLTVGF